MHTDICSHRVTLYKLPGIESLVPNYGRPVISLPGVAPLLGQV